jgi:hypothetical protein
LDDIEGSSKKSFRFRKRKISIQNKGMIREKDTEAGSQWEKQQKIRTRYPNKRIKSHM